MVFAYNVGLGQWKDNKKHGFGIFLWADGRKYEGFWAGD